MKSIVFFGECMLENQSDGNIHFGGDTLNTALYLARTSKLETLTISYATAVGTDHFSEKLLQCWQNEGINNQYVSQFDDKDVGSYSIQTDNNGERTFIYDRLNSAVRSYFKKDHADFTSALTNRTCDYVYISGISLAILDDADRIKLLNMLTAFKNEGGYIVFDNNYRQALWQNVDPICTYQQVMKLADLAFLTDEDEYALYSGNTVESIIERTDKWQIPEVVIKQGDKPCIIKYNNQLTKVGSMKIPANLIVDTCAAGDAFSAGYLAKRLAGESVIVAAKFAHQLAGEVIQHPGAIILRENMCHLMLPHHSPQ
jgi:2-dehydro-3-deoxygluconokinase